MLGKQRAFEVLESAIGAINATGLDGEAAWSGYREATMRSAAGEVHQTPVGVSGELTVTLRRGLRSADVTTEASTSRRIKEAVQRCANLLSDAPENPYLPDLVSQPEILPEEEFQLQGTPVFAHDLEAKEEAFWRIQKITATTPFAASARFFTAGCEVGVANTAGLLRYHTAKAAHLGLTLADDRNVSSYAGRSANSLEAIHVDPIIVEVLERAALARRLPLVDPFADGKGARTFGAVLTPYAVGEWLQWLSWFVFNGLAVHEESSFLSGRAKGDHVTGPNVSLIDDWKHIDSIPLPFNFSGRTRKTLGLIDRGIYGEVPYGGMTAKKAGTAPTGHDGSIPINIVMEGGDVTFADLVARSTNPTIVCTYLNYPSMPDPNEAVFTATTRHGTFLVEGGEYRAVCPPLRLRTKSFQAWESIDGMTRPQTVIAHENYGMFYPCSCVVPAMRLTALDFVDSVKKA